MKKNWECKKPAFPLDNRGIEYRTSKRKKPWIKVGMSTCGIAAGYRCSRTGNA